MGNMWANKILVVDRKLAHRDNLKTDNKDREWKVRSWVNDFQEHLRKSVPEGHTSDDEIIYI